MDRPYLLIAEYTFSYREGYTLSFETEETRQAYANALLSKNAEFGTSDYLRVSFATLTEQVS